MDDHLTMNTSAGQEDVQPSSSAENSPSKRQGLSPKSSPTKSSKLMPPPLPPASPIRTALRAWPASPARTASHVTASTFGPEPGYVGPSTSSADEVLDVPADLQEAVRSMRATVVLVKKLLESCYTIKGGIKLGFTECLQKMAAINEKLERYQLAVTEVEELKEFIENRFKK